MGKYLLDELNTEEQAVFDEWLAQQGNDQLWKDIRDKNYALSQLARRDQINANREEGRTSVFKKLHKISLAKPPVRLFSRNWQRYTAAASVCFLISVGIYLWYGTIRRTHIVKVEENKSRLVNDAAPGQFKARLTLADGSVVVLDSAALGKMAQQGNTTIINKGGQLVYVKQNQSSQGNEVLYNTLNTTKGETYSTTLSDGSKIWLNSQSSIRHPVVFGGKERKVEITGEAYFEIATVYNKDRQKGKIPFIVRVNDMEVEVLGTHFNINAYTDEDDIRTTLLEGKVRILNGSSSTMLQPGQKAIIRRGDNSIKVMKNVNVEQAVAWKNGLFMFNDVDIKSVMRQLARWYDLEVIYKGAIPMDTYSGNFPRDLHLAEVLNILQKSDVHFKIEGKQLIVTP